MIVAQLWRYPVKALGGERLAQAQFTLRGIPLDRSYAVLDSDPLRSGKLLTASRAKRLLAYRSFARGDGVLVRTPSGRECAADDGAWLDELEGDIGKPASLRSSEEPMHDDADLLVVNAASVRALSEEYGAPINPMRFRPNVILDAVDARPFEETAWPGETFDAGEALVEVVHPCERCVVTTIDPETFESDASFLKLIVQEHHGHFGVLCRVLRTGVVHAGDEWRAKDVAEAAS